MKKTQAELERDARKAVAEFNKSPRGTFLLAMSRREYLRRVGSTGEDKTAYLTHRTIQ